MLAPLRIPKSGPVLINRAKSKKRRKKSENRYKMLRVTQYPRLGPVEPLRRRWLVENDRAQRTTTKMWRHQLVKIRRKNQKSLLQVQKLREEGRLESQSNDASMGWRDRLRENAPLCNFSFISPFFISRILIFVWKVVSLLKVFSESGCSNIAPKFALQSNAIIT